MKRPVFFSRHARTQPVKIIL